MPRSAIVHIWQCFQETLQVKKHERRLQDYRRTSILTLKLYLEALVSCLEEFDPGVKEAAAWALGYIARHNEQLAQSVVDAGAVPILVLSIQVCELILKFLISLKI